MRAREVLKALQRNGFVIKSQSSSHRKLFKRGIGNYTFSFDLNEDIGPKMLSRIAKKTGLQIEDFSKKKKGK